MTEKPEGQRQEVAMESCIGGIGVGLLLIAVTLCAYLYWSSGRPKCKTKVPACTMIILGSGGHTREMLSIVESLATKVYSPRIYIYSKSDVLSSLKAMNLEENRNGNSNCAYISIPRSREVGQGWISSFFTTAYSLVNAFYIFAKIQPDLILCNGPGVCVPLCAVAFFMKKCWNSRVKIVYVESICRLQKLSLSGVLLRHIVDKFYVQWEHLKDKYPGTEYIGRLA